MTFAWIVARKVARVLALVVVYVSSIAPARCDGVEKLQIAMWQRVAALETLDWTNSAAVALVRDPIAQELDRIEEVALDPSRVDEVDVDARRAYVYGIPALARFLKWEPALARLESGARAGRLLPESDGDLRGHVTVDRVRILRTHGRVAEALAVVDEAMSGGGDAPIFLPVLGVERATMQRALGDFAGALASLASAEELLLDRRPKDPVGYHATTRAESAGERAQVFLELGRLDLAAPLIDLEESLARETGDAKTYCGAILHRLHFLLACEDYAEALAFAERARADQGLMSVADPEIGPAIDARAVQALARIAADDPRTIPMARERARAITVDMLTTEEQVLVALAASRIERLAGDPVAARAAVDRANAVAGVAPTATLAARIRSAAAACVLDEMAAASASGSESAARAELTATAEKLRGAVRGLLEEWDAAPPLPSGLGFFHFAFRCELVAEAIRVEAALDPGVAGTARAFELLLAVDARSRLGGGHAATIEELRTRTLAPDEVLIAWLPAPERTQIFVLSRDTLERFETVGITSLRAAARQLESALDDGIDSTSSGKLLFELLFPPAVRPRLDAARLVTLNGLDFMGAVSVEAAVLPDGSRLGCARAITRAPSLAWLADRARRPAVARGRDFLLVAAPEHSLRVLREHPELAPLTLADVSANEFMRLYADAELLAGPRASASELRRALAQSPSILQFVVHGYLDPAAPRPACLVLAADGELAGMFTCEDAESLPGVELVVLAACRVGAGPLRRGDAGATDLAGAFLFGGSGAVISTSGDVRARPVARLMFELYRRMLAGEAPSVALAASRRLLLAETGGDPAERARVAMRFRLDGLGHRVLTLGGAASAAVAPSAQESSDSSDASGTTPDGAARPSERRVAFWVAAAGAILVVLAAARWRRRSKRSRRSATDRLDGVDR